MSKHSQHQAHKSGKPPLAEIKARLERARAEGRYQQALDLVKQVYAAEGNRQVMAAVRTHLDQIRTAVLGEPGED